MRNACKQVVCFSFLVRICFQGWQSIGIAATGTNIMAATLFCKQSNIFIFFETEKESRFVKTGKQGLGNTLNSCCMNRKLPPFI